MLAYYVEWHMRQALAPLLFDDDDKATAEAQRDSPFAERTRQGPHLTHGGWLPRTQLPDPARRSRHDRQEPHPAQTAGADGFDQITPPTPLQRTAFDLLGVKL
jgi:hypothetical protein